MILTKLPSSSVPHIQQTLSLSTNSKPVLRKLRGAQLFRFVTIRLVEAVVVGGSGAEGKRSVE